MMLKFADQDQAVAAALAEHMSEAGALFERQLSSDLPAVNTLCRHVERYRGKMLRPAMVFLCGMACGPITDRHRILAATCEMIHMATLVHDDVLDEAEIRRRGHTVNHLRGNEVAVMLGDYLISNAFHLCSQAGDTTLNLRLGEITNCLCEGELVQLHHRDNLSLDERTYFEIVRRKTAVLIGACCELGARLSGAQRPVEQALYRFGEGLGVAFQIQDDLLDLEGHEDIVGKSLGRDLEKGKLTLPVILHLATATGAEREASFQDIRNRNGARLVERLRASGSVDAARTHAEALCDTARNELNLLPESGARAALCAAADAVIQRQF